MKIIKNTVKAVFFLSLIICIGLFALIFVLNKNVSSSYRLKTNEELVINSPVPVTVLLGDQKYETGSAKKAGDKYNVNLKMFGVIPFSSTTVEIVDEMSVVVLGNPFGMKLYTDGVLVTKIEDIITENGKENPAKRSGLAVGDYIKYVNGIQIVSNEDLAELVNESGGEEIALKIIRNGKKKSLKIKPALEKKTNLYRVGIWVKDSSAGIGTLTFYSPADNTVCGLGHPVCDSDTDKIISLNYGEMVGAEIISYEKGEAGSPGELNGKFTSEKICNEIVNDESGVYGCLCGNIKCTTLTKIALKQEVKSGYCQVLTTIDGKTPKLYSAKIEVGNNLKSNQNLKIKITDSELIEKTGGIIQGMSGSPILQNGRLIGAITHVLVDDPTTGYAIFAENMLETAQSVANSEKLRDAS